VAIPHTASRGPIIAQGSGDPANGQVVDRARAFSLGAAEFDHSGEGPSGPWFAPWDFLQFGDANAIPLLATKRGSAHVAAHIHVRWLTATAEQIVEQARVRQPALRFLDERDPPHARFEGWVLRQRRSGRRTLL